ncbi:hypothetical protein ACFLVI_03660 [Chloroflexota bacterium]
MEAFEHIVKVFLEYQGYAVATNVKFPVRRKTKKAAYDEYQTHGYEVDVVGAKSSSLLLGSVKSFLGSKGVSRQGFIEVADASRKTHFGQYNIFNEADIQNGIVKEAAKKYGYPLDQIELCLFVGRFNFEDREIITNCLKGKGVRVYDLDTIMEGLLKAAEPNTYMDDPVVVTVKALQLAGRLRSNLR